MSQDPKPIPAVCEVCLSCFQEQASAVVERAAKGEETDPAKAGLTSLLESLRRLSRYHSQLLLRRLLEWRKRALQHACPNREPAHTPPVLRRRLAIEVLFLQATQHVVKGASTVSAEQSRPLEHLCINWFLYVEKYVPLPELAAGRDQVVANCSQLLGALSPWHLRSILDRLADCIRERLAPPPGSSPAEQASQRAELMQLCDGLKLLRFSFDRNEQAAASAAGLRLMNPLSWVAPVKKSQLQHKLCSLLTEMLEALVVSDSVNNCKAFLDRQVLADWYSAVEGVRIAIVQWLARAAKHHLHGYPLMTQLICLERDPPAGAFPGLVDGLVDKLVDRMKEKTLRALAVNCLADVVQQYLMRNAGVAAVGDVVKWLERVCRPVLLAAKKNQLQTLDAQHLIRLCGVVVQHAPAFAVDGLMLPLLAMDQCENQIIALRSLLNLVLGSHHRLSQGGSGAGSSKGVSSTHSADPQLMAELTSAGLPVQTALDVLRRGKQPLELYGIGHLQVKVTQALNRLAVEGHKQFAGLLALRSGSVPEMPKERLHNNNLAVFSWVLKLVPFLVAEQWGESKVVDILPTYTRHADPTIAELARTALKNTLRAFPTKRNRLVAHAVPSFLARIPVASTGGEAPEPVLRTMQFLLSLMQEWINIVRDKTQGKLLEAPNDGVHLDLSRLEGSGLASLASPHKEVRRLGLDVLSMAKALHQALLLNGELKDSGNEGVVTYAIDIIQQVGPDMVDRCFWDLGPWSDLLREQSAVPEGLSFVDVLLQAPGDGWDDGMPHNCRLLVELVAEASTMCPSAVDVACTELSVRLSHLVGDSGVLLRTSGPADTADQMLKVDTFRFYTAFLMAGRHRAAKSVARGALGSREVVKMLLNSARNTSSAMASSSSGGGGGASSSSGPSDMWWQLPLVLALGGTHPSSAEVLLQEVKLLDDDVTVGDVSRLMKGRSMRREELRSFVGHVYRTILSRSALLTRILDTPKMLNQILDWLTDTETYLKSGTTGENLQDHLHLRYCLASACRSLNQHLLQPLQQTVTPGFGPEVRRRLFETMLTWTEESEATTVLLLNAAVGRIKDASEAEATRQDLLLAMQATDIQLHAALSGLLRQLRLEAASERKFRDRALSWIERLCSEGGNGSGGGASGGQGLKGSTGSGSFSGASTAVLGTSPSAGGFIIPGTMAVAASAASIPVAAVAALGRIAGPAFLGRFRLTLSPQRSTAGSGRGGSWGAISLSGGTGWKVEVARRALNYLLTSNLDQFAACLEHCYSEEAVLAAVHFQVLTEVYEAHNIEAEPYRLLSLVLYKIVDPSPGIRHQALHLYKLLAQRHWPATGWGEDRLPQLRGSEAGAKMEGSMHGQPGGPAAADGGSGGAELAEIAEPVIPHLAESYQRWLLSISRQLAQAHPELSEALSVEVITRQLDKGLPAEHSGRGVVLAALEPWVAHLRFQMRWESSWAERFLKSLYFVTRMHGSRYRNEIEALWLQVAANKKNIIPVLDFLITSCLQNLAGEAGQGLFSVYFTVSKRITLFLARACPQATLDHLVYEMSQLISEEDNDEAMGRDVQELQFTAAADGLGGGSAGGGASGRNRANGRSLSRKAISHDGSGPTTSASKPAVMLPPGGAPAAAGGGTASGTGRPKAHHTRAASTGSAASSSAASYPPLTPPPQLPWSSAGSAFWHETGQAGGMRDESALNSGSFHGLLGRKLSRNNLEPGRSVMNRPQVALALLTEVAYEHVHHLQAHLPTIVHVALLVADCPEPLVHSHALELLINILYTSTGQQDHLLPGAAQGPPSGSTSAAARKLLVQLQSVTSGPMWQFEDASLQHPVCSSETSVAHLTLSVVDSLSGEKGLRDRWAEVALSWALYCSSRHLTGRSHQVLRALSVPMNAESCLGILQCLQLCCRYPSQGSMDCCADLLHSLQSMVEGSNSRKLLLYPQVFWSTLALLLTPYTCLFATAMWLLASLLRRLDLYSQLLQSVLLACAPADPAPSSTSGGAAGPGARRDQQLNWRPGLELLPSGSRPLRGMLCVQQLLLKGLFSPHSEAATVEVLVLLLHQLTRHFSSTSSHQPTSSAANEGSWTTPRPPAASDRAARSCWARTEHGSSGTTPGPPARGARLLGDPLRQLLLTLVALLPWLLMNRSNSASVGATTMVLDSLSGVCLSADLADVASRIAQLSPSNTGDTSRHLVANLAVPLVRAVFPEHAGTVLDLLADMLALASPTWHPHILLVLRSILEVQDLDLSEYLAGPSVGALLACISSMVLGPEGPMAVEVLDALAAQSQSAPLPALTPAEEADDRGDKPLQLVVARLHDSDVEKALEKILQVPAGVRHSGKQQLMPFVVPSQLAAALQTG